MELFGTICTIIGAGTLAYAITKLIVLIDRTGKAFDALSKLDH